MAHPSPPNSRRIACVYCAGEHNTTDEVRQCWQAHEGAEAQPAATRADPQRVTVGAATRGPAILGRNAVVAPNMPAPAEWAEVRRVRVDSSSAALVDELQTAAQSRTGLVFEIAPELDASITQAFSSDRAPHEVGPNVRFTTDQLRHLLYSNSVDARGDTNIAGAGWAVLDDALTLGAHPAPDGVGDILLPDGSPVWLDGGPPRYTAAVDGVPVVHRIAIEHGSLRPPAGNSTPADLAADQLAAVTHDGGAARIIAPAGSGKTRVLTERARHLVKQWNVPPSALTLIAFNKRAQEEIAERTTDLPGLQVRTLNAIALAIINGSAPFARQPQRVATIDEPAVRRLLSRMIKFPRVRNADPMATWIEALSVARLGLVDPDDIEARYAGEVTGFPDVFAKYRGALAAQNTVDFDDQIFRAIELLLRDPHARATAQRCCRLLLVDEFQDLTPAHILLIRLLAGPDAAVFGVGDDDQTIYGYNGADPAWLIDFDSLFSGAGTHPLEINYRCPPGVVRAADTLLRHNRRRVAKSIRPDRHDGDGFMVAPENRDSVAITVEAVLTALGAGDRASDVAILTRVNSLLVPIQVALGANGIAASGGSGPEYLERTAVRATLAWLRLAQSSGSFSNADVAEALRRPSRQLHPRIASWVGEQSSLDGLRRLATRITTERDAITVDKFAADISKLQQLVAGRATTAQLFSEVHDSFGLASSIAKLDAHRHGMNRSAQNDDLTALKQLANLQSDPALFESWLRAALTNHSTTDADAVTLATVHRVKGLEWPFVIVHYADAEQFPHRLSDDIEEERRIFHVAITRASRDVLVVPSDRPSPFITDCSTTPSPAAQRTEPAPKRESKPAAAAAVVVGNTQLFEELRALRLQLAAGKPAFTVLADAALRAIADARPTSLDQLSAIKGIGPAKLEQYGGALLAAVAASSTQTSSS